MTARTYTIDGRLHISRSHITKAAVNPYYGKEIPGADGLGLDPDRIYMMLRDPDELAKAVDGFKMLPILNKHVFIELFDRMDEEERKQHIVGSTGSDVEFLLPYLDSDVCIWESHAIVGIETEKVREFSCSYRYVPVMTTGAYEGVKYDGIMTQIQPNHLALVESGRAGNDVLAADSELEITPMKRTKLGNALIVALTTAFPKVTVANDSELEKILAPANRTSFQKHNALSAIVAMDASIDSKQVNAVMDALVDVDDPEPKKHPKDCDCADCKEARADDEEDEEDDEDDEDEKKKKSAKDKKAAKDSDDDKKDSKAAMDSAIAASENRLRAEFKAADEAKRDVRPVVGDVVAMDSAEAIYDFALNHLKVDHAGVTGIAAKRALFKLASDRQSPTPTVHVAMDASQHDVLKNYPGIAKNMNRISIQ
jgi:hypothetical protein